MAKISMLPARPCVGNLKPLSSAKTFQSILPNGQLLLTIEHELVRDVTPKMLAWWFENLSQTISYQGKTYPIYLLWHPIDHIHWELANKAPNGGAGQGASFRIVEVFGANPNFYVDSTEVVEKLDEEGISLSRRILGTEIFRLEHRFGATPNGTIYKSRMIVGAATGIGKFLFNHAIRPLVFSNAMGTAWLKHNIEEVGLLEHLLPMVYLNNVPTNAS